MGRVALSWPLVGLPPVASRCQIHLATGFFAPHLDMPNTEVITANCMDWMRTQPDKRFRLTMTSPPYEDARTYGINYKARRQDWVDSLVPIIVECCRLTDGLVCVNMSARVREYSYSCAVEWLVADLTRLHGVICGPSPYVFYRIGIPGSGQRHYHRRDWEPVYCFCLPDRLPLKHTNNLYFGKPSKYKPGGAMSHRNADGKRRNEQTSRHSTKNQWSGSASMSQKRRQNGERDQSVRPSHQDVRQYAAPPVANPGNVIRCNVGGGHMGSRHAAENEAPMPERLAEFFIRSFSEQGSTIFDPFCGSGTTLAVAKRTNRHSVGVDVRDSQVKLTLRRLTTVQPELPFSEASHD